MVVRWRDGLSATLADHLSGRLDWDEGPTSPYFTDKPTWDCYSDLLLWAAYDEQPQLPRPTYHVDDFGEDPAYRACTAEGVSSRYTHLYGAELWLPCSFDSVFEAQDVGGNSTLIGSSIVLQRQLKELNARTWRGSKEVLKRWWRDGSDYGAPLESGARFAFALVAALAANAVENRLPMRLDY